MRIFSLGCTSRVEYLGPVRVVLQRVREASVTVDEKVTGAIGAGLLLLVGIAPGDGSTELSWMARKIVGLRIFSDEQGRMNRSLLEAEGSILAVSQFTLFGDIRKGRRPSFTGAGPPEMAEPAFNDFCECLRGQGARVETGVFGAHMDVRLLNDGPVTLVLERPELGSTS